jgi:hypothetical protein
MRILASTCLVSALLVASPPPAVKAQGSPAAGRVFEMRTYIASPGRLDALNARFRNHTLGLFRKHGMEVVGFWVPVEKKDGADDKLVYILAFPSRADAQAAWKAFREDPEWVKVKADSEADGTPLAAKIESVFLTATDYSAIR